MTKQPEDWLDDVPGDDIEDEDDEIIWVSKSEIKRDAEELKRLGAELVDLGKNALDKIPLDRTCATPLNWHSESKRRPPPPAAAYR
jgi:ribosome-associated protein